MNKIFWKAFHTLSMFRPSGGMGVQRIPYESISRYAEDFKLISTAHDFEEFIAIMSAMDDVWMKHATPSETKK